MYIILILKKSLQNTPYISFLPITIFYKCKQPPTEIVLMSLL